MAEALLITPVRPDPFGGGPAKRAHQWQQALARTHRVHVLVIGRGVPAAASPGEAEPHTFPLSGHSRWRSAGRLLGLVPMVGAGVTPLEWVSLSPALATWLARELEGRRYERIVCFRLCLAEVAAHVAGAQPQAVTTLDLDDLEAETRRSIARGLLGDAHPLRALLVASEVGAWRAREVSWGRRFAGLAVCCEADRLTVSARLPEPAVQVFPNRLWRPAISASPSESADARLVLFVGSLAYAPNELAAAFFARRVMPRLLRQHPGWRFAVVGRGASQALQRLLSRCDGTRYVGPVEDVASWYARCGMVVAPLQAGGGTKLKVLEALGFARPLIATQEAVRGLDLVEGEHFLAAETAAAFAAACVRLEADAPLRAALSREGRRQVLAHFAYE